MESKKLKYKNYYKILNLKSSRVTEDEIKSAYRKLAKKSHPDLNKGNLAIQEKFKEITEAYQVLGDPRLRKRYNIWYYMHFAQNGVNLTFVGKNLKAFRKSEFAKIFVGEEITNKDINKSTTPKQDNEVTLKLTMEEAFLGTIKQLNVNFDDEERNVKIRVPRGVREDSRVVLKGEGKINKDTGEREDLNVKIFTMPNKNYVLEGIDLYKAITISPSEAVLGATKKVESIDGEYNLAIPSGVQNGEKITIPQAGFISKELKRGDLIVTIDIAIPKELTEQEKELYSKLKKLHS